MIFVSVGTHEAPFDRLLRAVYDIELDEEVIVQHGPSTVRSERAVEAPFLPFEQVVDHVRRARAVVTHAGVGSVMIALANGKRPVVMARRKEFGEHVDDHQLELARRMHASGLAIHVEDGQGLVAALGSDLAAGATESAAPWLGTDLEAYLRTHLEGADHLSLGIAAAGLPMRRPRLLDLRRRLEARRPRGRAG